MPTCWREAYGSEIPDEHHRPIQANECDIVVERDVTVASMHGDFFDSSVDHGGFAKRRSIVLHQPDNHLCLVEPSAEETELLYEVALRHGSRYRGSTVKTPVSGRSIPVLDVKLKRGRLHFGYFSR